MPSLRPEFVSVEAGAAKTEMAEDGILAVFRKGPANFGITNNFRALLPASIGGCGLFSCGLIRFSIRSAWTL